MGNVPKRANKNLPKTTSISPMLEAASGGLVKGGEVTLKQGIREKEDAIA